MAHSKEHKKKNTVNRFILWNRKTRKRKTSIQKDNKN